MVAGKTVCLRQLSRGNRALEVRFNRFLGHDKVTVDRIIESWSNSTGPAVEGRHVLAIQDTSEIHFNTTPQRRRGLGEIGKGNNHGVLLHPLLAVDADDGSCLGLLSGQIWTRAGRRTTSHDDRELSDKESQRWISTAVAARPLLTKAAAVTVLGDRESDIFALYASSAKQHFHVIARSMHDRKLADRSSLYEASDAMAAVDQRMIQLPARAARPARLAHLELRFGAIELARPQNKLLHHLPKSLPLAVVDVREINAETGIEPLHWRLLTSHEVTSIEDAWRIVQWYKQRWIIEQFFRILKTQEPQARRQSDRIRRSASQAGCDRRQGGRHHHPASAGPQWWSPAHSRGLRQRPNWRAHSPQPATRSREQATKEPTSAR
ncbi:hypothetical protein ABIF94_004458 [Bradyrhizobium ottawaense]|uniref:IS4 family transposase n=1 Tax=Bradyrhizobium ottawaense TaxID=931866 RepID=UPI003832DE7C